MPKHEWKCKACGHRFELPARDAVVPPPPCPQCSAPETVRAYSVGFVTPKNGWGH